MRWVKMSFPNYDRRNTRRSIIDVRDSGMARGRENTCIYLQSEELKRFAERCAEELFNHMFD